MFLLYFYQIAVIIYSLPCQVLKIIWSFCCCYFVAAFILRYLSIAIAIVEFALGCAFIKLLSNYRYYIQFALLSCKSHLVFLLLLLYCGILVFRLCKYWLNSSFIKLKFDLKENKSLNTSKNCYDWYGCSLFIFTQSHFSSNSSLTS